MSPVSDVQTYIATIENFRTLAQKTQDELIQPHIGREAYNLRFDETYGVMKKRYSRSLYGSMATLGTAQVLGAYRYYKNSTDAKKQIIAYDTMLKLGSDTVGTFTDIATGLTADLHWTWLTYKDLCYGFNGTDNNQVYDGTNNCVAMGVPIPDAVTQDATAKLLIHFDGTDGDKADYTAETGQTVSMGTTLGLDTQLDTAQKVFGTASVLLDGTDDYFTVPDNANWNFGTGKFGIDLRVRFSALAINQDIYVQYNDGTHYIALWYSFDVNKLYFDAMDGTTLITITCPFTPIINTWYHIAIVRDGNAAANWFMYHNQIAAGAASTTSTAQTKTLLAGGYNITMPDINGAIFFGEAKLTGHFAGWMDEIRVVKGAAPWNTATFTVPTSAYSYDSGSGNPNGVYKYKVTYLIDDYQEGTASDASSEITVTSAKVNLTIPISTNTRVTQRKLYRTLASGSIYYYLATIDDNSTTFYNDNIADGSLGTDVAPDDYSAPGAYKLSCLHNSRFFLGRNATYKSRVIYSDVRSGTSYPDVYPALNYFDILKDNGEELTFVGEDNYGQLICMKPSAVVKVNTDTDDPVGWSGFNSVISVNGCVASSTAVKTHIGIIYLSRYGETRKKLVVWNGSSVQPIFEELEPILNNILDTRLDDLVGHYHNGCYYLAYNDISTGETYNNRVLIIDLINNSWVIDQKKISCFCSWNAGTDWGELYTGSSDTSGFLYKEDSNLSGDLFVRYKSELDAGTFDSACETGGTEVAPTLILKLAGLTTQVGAKLVSAATDIVSTLATEGDNETVAPSCTYLSPILEVSAKSLLYLYWSEIIGSGGYCRLWIRTGDTEAAVALASWSGSYSTATGSDISGVTAAKYIQYRVKLYVTNTANYAGTYLKRAAVASPDDFVVKVTFGYGTKAETTIPMEYMSHWDDFGWLNPQFKRIRKRMRAMRLEFERSEASGTLTFGYYKDYGIRTDVDFSLSSYASRGYVLYNFPLGVYFNKWRYRIYNNDNNEILIKRVNFTLSPEPYQPNL